MIFLEACLIFAMLYTSILASSNDIKHAIVPNRILIPAYIIALIINIVYYSLFASTYFASWGKNMMVADIIAIIMYAAGLWAAGDVKLFMLLYLCFPGRFILSNVLADAIIPYIFVFIPGVIWLVADTIYQVYQKAERFGQRFDGLHFIKCWLLISIEASGFRSLFSALFPTFYYENGLFCSAVILIYAYFCGSNQRMLKPWIVILHAVIYGVCGWFLGFELSIPSATHILIILIILWFQHFSAQYNYRKINTSDVVPGMILSATTILQFQKSRVNGLPTNLSESATAKITVEEANAVKRWEFSKHGAPFVVIVRKIPFALLIAIGFITLLVYRIVGYF